MEQNDIILDGISILTLKAQKDKIRQSAVKLIAEQIDIATSLTEKLIESKDKEEIKKLAEEAYKALSQANLVSDASGVTFNLPFDYDYGDQILSSLLEESENEVLNEMSEESLSNLTNLFYTMERKSKRWNASMC